ncbi:multifunctional nucleotidyltransferase/glutamate rich protein GrpB/ribosomal protein alanine acetyltransferase [Legionella santicrucis]|uniref:Multifunctional nucleotidyltransferase/glutamate rich protein GrpB/ribosomal protein alanine acetyltransferase n=2 Tax=Legionella santicrucis TaxID=45074 RepID=A0A0W0YA20_9GAMM|nr:multifunctional nucleotidyltransferase/glutamate rich protein GrpB/ribosomal protein alanine acetyltransferase [Legionella santicrucis]
MIETSRLILRPPQIGDALPLNQAVNRSLEALQRWMPWATDPSLETTAIFVKDAVTQWQAPHPTQFPMVVVLRENNLIIGGSGYNEKSNFEVPMFEIGYWLDTTYVGLGLATELVQALTRHAFEKLNAIRVQICMQKENTKSIRVAEKCGFILEATLHHFRLDCLTQKPVDELIYARFDTNRL